MLNAVICTHKIECAKIFWLHCNFQREKKNGNVLFYLHVKNISLQQHVTMSLVPIYCNNPKVMTNEIADGIPNRTNPDQPASLAVAAASCNGLVCMCA